MGLIGFSNLAKYGVINEVPDHATPPTAWTVGNNIAFRDGYVQSAKGYSPLSAGDDASNPLKCRPQYLLPYYDADSDKLFWIYPGLNDAGKGLICTYDGDLNVDRTNLTDYPSTDFYGATVRWTGAIVNGVCAINNGITVPQMWDRGVTGALDADFSNLTNWPANHTAAVLRGFRNFFIGLDITDTGNDPDRNPYEVMHSGIVDPYTAPPWAALTTNRAGSKYIGEGGGVLVDCLPMRGQNIIYSEREAWPMAFVGGNEVFAIGDKALLEYGMLTQGCAAAFGAGYHFVVTVGDIIVHDGANADSIIDGKMRDRIFADIDSNNFINSFVVSHFAEGEIWFCYPSAGFTHPNRIAKWNIKANVWSYMELPIEVAAIKYGATPEGGHDGVWDTDSEVWDDDDAVWNEGNYNPTVNNLMMASPDDTIADSALLKGDDGVTFDGVDYTCTLEKTGLTVVGQNGQGYISDANVDKYLYEIWPKIQGGPVSVQLGTAQHIDGPYVWTPAQSFDPATQRKLDFRPVEGYYGAVRFTSDGVNWTLDGFDLGVQTTGSRG